jgi:hypothetical protein
MPLLPPHPQPSKLYLLSGKNQERPKLDFAYRHFRLFTGVPFSFGQNLFGQNPGLALFRGTANGFLGRQGNGLGLLFHPH